MKKQYACPHCFVNLSMRRPTCPHCGRPNPYYDPEADEEPAELPRTLHHPDATAGTCPYCDSVLYSDEKYCSGCGAPNPNFVVHGNVRAFGGERAHGTGNASTGKCPYCGGTLRSNEPTCPTCGGANPHYVLDPERVIRTPQTIEELREYCAERDMPLLRMRFFIGENTQEPKAFGIYRDEAGQTVVYKNKADGSRAVRYSGLDEARGVREIWNKLLEECRSRGIDPDHSLPKENRAARQSSTASRAFRQTATAQKRARARRRPWLMAAVCFGLVLLMILYGVYRARNSNSYTPLDGSSYSSWHDSGSSGWDSWDSGSDWDSGSSGWNSWDSGSDSWDNWDSGDSDWGSDW